MKAIIIQIPNSIISSNLSTCQRKNDICGSECRRQTALLPLSHSFPLSLCALVSERTVQLKEALHVCCAKETAKSADDQEDKVKAWIKNCKELKAKNPAQTLKELQAHILSFLILWFGMVGRWRSSSSEDESGNWRWQWKSHSQGVLVWWHGST